MAYYLQQVTYDKEPIIIPLTEVEVIVGRNIEQLRRYPQISEQHAKFLKIKDCMYIRNLDCQYGTYLNGIKIDDKINPLSYVDEIGFGVNTVENGFVCKLVYKPFEEICNTRNKLQTPIKKESPEIIYLSDDEDFTNTAKIVNPTCLDFKTSGVQESASSLNHQNVEVSVKQEDDQGHIVHDAPSTSRELTVKKIYPLIKQCSVRLGRRCDSESFQWPADVKNPFLIESEDDDDSLGIPKKRRKRINSDSSDESFEYSSKSIVKMAEGEQNQFNNNANKNSSKMHVNGHKNFTHSKKHAKKIICGSFDESLDESINPVYHKSQRSLPKQIKIVPSVENIELPESSSLKGSVNKFKTNACSNTYPLMNYEIPKLKTSISDSDDVIDVTQHFISRKNRPEDTEDSECHNTVKEIVEGDDEEMESIEKIEQYVNISDQGNPVECEAEEAKEFNSELTDTESEISLEDSYLPSVKSILSPGTKYDNKKSSNSVRKTLLIEPKPMTYQPHCKRGRDGYVERQKTPDLYPKRKRGRPRKEEQLKIETNLNSSITKIPNKTEERTTSVNNFSSKSLPKIKDSPAGLSRVKDISAKNLLPNPKSIQLYPSEHKRINGDCSKIQQSLHSSMKRKKTKCCSGLGDELNNSDYQQQLSEQELKKNSRKSTTSSVKRRPDKFCSRMGFLTELEETKHVTRDKTLGKTKKCNSNAGENDASQMQFADKIGTEQKQKDKQILKQMKTVEKVSYPQNVPLISYIEDKHPELKISSFSHTSQKNNSEGNNSQKIPGFSTNDTSSTYTLQDTNFKDNSHQSISHSSDALSSRNLQVENLKDNYFQSIPRSSTNASSKRFLQNKNSKNNDLQSNSCSSDALRNPNLQNENLEDNFQNTSHIIDDMVKDFLNFNTKWLKEQCEISYPPPEVIKGVENLPLFFTTYESYAASFYPLLKLEIWHCMFEASKEVSNKVLTKEFNFRVLSFVNKSDHIELKCESVIKDKFCFEPREGNMVVLEMKLNTRQAYPVFGFIAKHDFDDLDLNRLHSCWKKSSDEYLKDAKHWSFCIWIKQKNFSLDSNILIKGEGLCYIRSRLRLVDALRCFKDSPLMTDIIEPRLQTFALASSKHPTSREYTSQQMEVIQSVCSEIHKSYLESKITLIQGPPGTGKTHIIMGILETLFCSSKNNSRLKVLVTAPSNVAVDQIGFRIVELNERFGGKDSAIKFVRVGAEKQVDSKMLPYFLDRKAMELIKKAKLSSKQKEQELWNLRLEILNLEKEPDGLNKRKMLKDLKSRHNSIEADYLQKKIVDYKTEIQYKCDILKESHVVLTTLSSCNLSILRKTFFPATKSDLNFSCCIVDESTQCTELEILQPLALGISKLVLFGDDKQLPAATSECTKKYGFDRSMLKRFCQYFENTKPNPVISLTEQFRMHPSICQFPSMYMYNRTLDTHPETISMYRYFPLDPYIIFNTAHSETIQNYEGLVSNICRSLTQLLDTSTSIGVIVSHESQRKFCTKILKSFSRISDIEVNTVNGFQGKEKDVVILCAIDSKHNITADSFIINKQKFNVALTRARKCLIICLDSYTLLEQYKALDHWKALIKDGHERKIISPITSPEDVSSVLRDMSSTRAQRLLLRGFGRK